MIIYVDGSYSTKTPDRYGWAFVACEDSGKIVYQENGYGTNAEACSMRNVAGELSAVMHAVVWAIDNNHKDFVIAYDYQGIGDWLTGAWKAKKPLVQSYVAFMQRAKTEGSLKIKLRKLAGHTGVAGNELADKLAKAAIA